MNVGNPQLINSSKNVHLQFKSLQKQWINFYEAGDAAKVP
jgi:hypothetical protein